MILKIESVESEWVLFDGIIECTMRENADITDKGREYADYDLTNPHPDRPRNPDGELYKMVRFKRKDNELLEKVVVFDGKAFLCNDYGQTIERL